MGNFICCGNLKNQEFSESEQKSQKPIKVLVLGQEQVGKDCLMSAMCSLGQRVCVGSESWEYKMKYSNRTLLFKRLKKNTPDFFQINIPSCLQDVDVVIICVDLSNASSMQNFSDHFLEKIIEYVRVNNNRRLRIMIAGCKNDKKVRNLAEEEQFTKKCKEIQIPFFKTSSTQNENIATLLDDVLLYQEKNLTQITIEEKISNLQNSRYMDVHSSLRDGGSNLNSQQSLTSKHRRLQSKDISNMCQDEESKFDSNNHIVASQQMNQQQYIRIIPHERMYSNQRVQLDKGNFGVVYKIDLEGEECALKICKIEMNEESSLNRFQIIFSEAENMQRFMLNRSMRIMPLKGISFQVDMNRQNVYIGYWMPLCKYSLKHLLKTRFNQITIHDKIRWSLQIIECLEIFDKEKIQHMDLKPQNILIDQNNDIIVSDLSMSKVFEEKHTEAFNMLGTTAKYAHPAAIINHELSPRFDIYSFGVIMLELFTGKQPWGDTKREELKEIYQQILIAPELMNPLHYHAENYPQEMKLIQGYLKPIKDIIQMCCVSIFIKEKKDDVTIQSIKLKFKELEEEIVAYSPV